MMALRPADDCPNAFHQRVNWGFTARLRFWYGIPKEAGDVREFTLPESFEDEVLALARNIIYPPRWWIPWAMHIEKALYIIVEEYVDIREEAFLLISLLRRIDNILVFRRMVWECKEATGFPFENKNMKGEN